MIRSDGMAGQSQGRVRAESHDFDEQIMEVLEAGPLSKKELAERLGLDQITGHLNRAVKRLVTS